MASLVVFIFFRNLRNTLVTVAGLPIILLGTSGVMSALHMTLKVNGAVKQDATTQDMIWGCAELIAFASRFMTLEPGDTNATGTPSGEGDASGTYLAVGDEMDGWVEGIGTLVTPVGPSVTETI